VEALGMGEEPAKTAWAQDSGPAAFKESGGLMNRRFACLLSAALALAGTQRAAAWASPAEVPHGVDILVNGAPVRRYAHEGRWYVEAIKGKEYAIRLRNPYGVRVAVALSVDGLNTIDARHTSAADARKWVLGPYETVTISGWQTSQTQARRFEFTTEARSYGQALGRTDNLGLITAVFFRERVSKPVPEVSRDRTEAGARAPQPSAPAEQDAASASRKSENEYAATGMGRPADHAVRQVWLDLEHTAAQTVDIRYEFRPQLVKLGVLRTAPTADPLVRRERARGFDPGFCPEPPRQR
jgi:hypothetical protein